jgi:hypothetical protein
MSPTIPSALAASIFVTAFLAADTAQDWSFTADTSGNDVHWSSPSDVDANAATHEFTFDITSVEAWVRYAGITWGPFDVTDQIPAEDRHQKGSADGPLPVTIVDSNIDFPPTLQAHMSFWLDESGTGHLDVTEIVFGTVTIDLGWPFGEVTADLERIRIQGNAHVNSIGSLCAADCADPPDGRVDVTDLLAVISDWGAIDSPRDVDGNGFVGVGDVLEVIDAWGKCE